MWLGQPRITREPSTLHATPPNAGKELWDALGPDSSGYGMSPTGFGSFMNSPIGNAALHCTAQCLADQSVPPGMQGLSQYAGQMRERGSRDRLAQHKAGAEAGFQKWQSKLKEIQAAEAAGNSDELAGLQGELKAIAEAVVNDMDWIHHYEGDATTPGDIEADLHNNGIGGGCSRQVATTSVDQSGAECCLGKAKDLKVAPPVPTSAAVPAQPQQQ